MLALAAAVARPWVDILLSGAATVAQIRANVAACEVPYDDDVDEELRALSINSADYWRARTSFEWN
jgi:aryl-alcohol dehydrogenase-like predicted oxidoreductase